MDTEKLTFILTHLHRRTDYSTILIFWQIQVIFTDDFRKMTESEENVLWMFI